MENNCWSCPSGPFEIFTNEDKTMSMRAAYKNTGLPLDLTSCTEIEVQLPNADGSFTNLLLSLTQVSIISPPVLGQISVPIPKAKAALLNVAVLQNVDVVFTISGLNTTVRFMQALSVFEF